jgi:hypothetical protein
MILEDHGDFTGKAPNLAHTPEYVTLTQCPL